MTAPGAQSDSGSTQRGAESGSATRAADGCDGIAYKSVPGRDFNIAPSHLDAADPLNCSYFETRKVALEFSQAGDQHFVKNQISGETMHGPDPSNKHPMAGFPQVCFIKNTVHNPNIIVGDYTYYDDPEDSENFERNVLYHYPFVGDRLIIGKFCAIARGARFIMNGANHMLSGISTYPFQIFGNGWEKLRLSPDDFPYKGDTVIGHDVWIGYDALIMPGVKVGNGAVISARAVVAGDVPAYALVGGNPARTIRQRFPPEVVEALEAVAWWDWPVEKITRNLSVIVSADIDALRACAAEP